ncbi:hypothetical protein RDWZM_005639 [Blomia tropicalis]|uniref:Peptidase M12B domain-containing protein n=1 Tax=Blomia tropicalis TaxID=40697 RepID=A0A9Q0M8T4_BLOTA|nr:hypothetical protein RDWZM_005639 [Blomia tropicalis]
MLVGLFIVTHVLLNEIFCMKQANNLPSPFLPIKNASLRTIHISMLLYYDNALVIRMRYDIDRLKKFLLSVVYSSWLSYNNHPMNKIANWVFHVVSIRKLSDSVKMDEDHDGNKYRERLNQYLNRFIDRYSVAVLFTGYNFLFNSVYTDTQGLGIMFSACDVNSDRTIIIEARSYRAAFVLAHEIGHTLGMDHDDSLCGSTYIMSATVGDGKAKFSKCSFKQLERRFNELFNSTIPSEWKIQECFLKPNLKNPLHTFPMTKVESFQSVSADEQCSLGLGQDFVASELEFSSNNICANLICSNRFIKMHIHPAIEYTICDINMYCRAGTCEN